MPTKKSTKNLKSVKKAASIKGGRKLNRRPGSRLIQKF
jgi:hypothetical protein